MLAAWSAAAIGAPPERTCVRQAPPAGFPSWAPVAVQSHDGSELLVSGTMEGSLWGLPMDEPVDGQGNPRVLRILHRGAEGSEGTLALTLPILTRLDPSGFVLRDGLERVVLLDRSLHPSKTVHLGASPKEGEMWVLRELVEAGGKLCGFADFKAGQGDATGYFCAAPESFPGVELGFRQGKDPALHSFFIMLIPTLATAGPDAYALRYEEGAHLFRMTGSPTRLTAFPPGFEELPRLPASRGMETAVVRARALARRKAAVAVFGGRRNLFVLSHQRRASGEGTLWVLSEIDPAKDRLIRNRVLPSTAEKVVLASGKKYWVALEQGPRKDVARQETERLLFIPTDWIEGEASPLPTLWKGEKAEPEPPMEICHARS